MKKIVFVLGVILLGVITNSKAHAQQDELEQLALNIEKLSQFKLILTDLKKGYEVVSKGYSTIRNISEGNFNLHQSFLDGLMQVSPAVKNYSRVKNIIDYQISLVKQYKASIQVFRNNHHFSAGELDYISKVYSHLFELSLQDLEELTAVLTANKLRMSDDERIKAIDHLFYDMQDKVSFVRHFNNSTSVLSLQRIKEHNDGSVVGSLYGIHIK